ncbi:hypothetical protein MPTK1_5g13480 [Marchantia polymorpha subsp. ruderalis]|uniref:Uncharacterized protein n=2 Tax=Marchantia polymorpha TaxID=3197 RepID=A0AAF6BHZ1_MARPO|nr:hypothetical protein MARPO_0032s0041 [Marchantia polymorpha]BBN11625.1 hypothetical protein Mp_5g13480 [Marchantia polymorpha subsp. ruderalis]|eukprot:PTQ41839.1 hypothetical protein MARPO_0032s0041 [Marchantia polymorpha]
MDAVDPLSWFRSKPRALDDDGKIDCVETVTAAELFVGAEKGWPREESRNRLSNSCTRQFGLQHNSVDSVCCAS